jgi:uncharacterized protein YebE (UPF0316 family)
MLIFCIGMAEMVFSTLWAKYVQETRVYASTMITVAHVFVWYYVLRTVIEQVNDISVVVMYAAGCGMGNLLVIMIGEQIKKRSTSKTRAKVKASQNGITVPAMPALITFDNI